MSKLREEIAALEADEAAIEALAAAPASAAERDLAEAGYAHSRGRPRGHHEGDRCARCGRAHPRDETCELLSELRTQPLQQSMRYQPGDRVRVVSNAPWRGATGTVEKNVPWGKHYVALDDGRRVFADATHLEPLRNQRRTPVVRFCDACRNAATVAADDFYYVASGGDVIRRYYCDEHRSAVDGVQVRRVADGSVG